MNRFRSGVGALVTGGIGGEPFQRHGKEHGRANTRLAVHPDSPTMQLNDEFADRQPQPCSADSRVGSISPVKTFKQMRLLLRCHADAAILYAYLKEARDRPAENGDYSPIRRVFNGIGE